MIESPAKPAQDITILPASLNDAHAIWEWRNDETTRKMSITTDEISWESHLRWYTQTLANENCRLYVGYWVGDKMGVCRFDLDSTQKNAEVSINLNPRYRGQKLSSPLLDLAISTFRHESDATLHACIKKINTSSIQCFTQLGFRCVREDDTYYYYRYYP